MAENLEVNHLVKIHPERPDPTMSKMQALQLISYEKEYQVNTVPIPDVGPNDLLIRVHAAGYCHTDYQVWQGVYKSPTPLIPSHEPVGEVVAIGKLAESKGIWRVGQRAGVLLFRHACGNCVTCLSLGDVRFCKGRNMAGLMNDGGMAQYIIGDADNCVLIPDEVSYEQAAPLMCAGTTVWAGIQAAKTPMLDPVGIIGIGGLGTLAVQFAKALGHPVVALDNRPEGRELATEFDLKADLVLDPYDAEAIGKIKAWSGRDGLAAVIVCTDNVEISQWSLRNLRPHGVAVPLGVPAEGYKFDAFDFIFNEVTIQGSLVSTRQQAEDMMVAVARHNVRSHLTVLSMQDGPKLPELYMDAHLKGRLVMKVD